MKKYPVFLALPLLLASCQDVIQLDLPENPPMLVINGRVTDSIPVYVDVMTTGPYYETQIPGVPDARVFLFEDGVKVDSLIEAEEGHYEGIFVGSPNRVYHIEVMIPDGNPRYEAGAWESKPELLKRCPPVDSLFSRFIPSQPFIPEGHYVFGRIAEPSGAGDLYRVRAWRNDTLQNTPFDIQVFSDELYDGQELELIIDGPRPVGTSYVIELSSIAKEHFNFLSLLRQQTGQVGSTFDPPPAAIIGNIHRKGDPGQYALGYFNAAKIEYADVVITE